LTVDWNPRNGGPVVGVCRFYPRL